MKSPPAPLKPLEPYLYKHPIGTKYILLDFKGQGGCPKGVDEGATPKGDNATKKKAMNLDALGSSTP